MKKNPLPLVLVSLFVLWAGCESINLETLGSLTGTAGQTGELSAETIIGGLKEALTVGIKNAVLQTAKKGGYSENPTIRIALPDKLKTAGDTLRTIGLGSQVDLLEMKMNEAAEDAASAATDLFIDAIRNMTFTDAKNILYGSDTAATDYLRKASFAPLKARYLPIVTQHMESLGVIKQYNDLVRRYEALPLVPKVNLSIEEYVSEQALNGLFTVVGAEEKKIRHDPAARTTELLRQIFTAR